MAVRDVDDERVHEITLEQNAVCQGLSGFWVSRRNIAHDDPPPMPVHGSDCLPVQLGWMPGRVAEDERTDGRVVAGGSVDRAVEQPGVSARVVDESKSR